jgi:HSP20 family protein
VPGHAIEEETHVASIVRYQPFRFPLSEMTREVDRAFERLLDDTFGGSRLTSRGAGWGTAANLYETNDGYWVELPLAGVRPEDVEITVQENALALKAKRTVQAPEGARTLWQGFDSAEWQRRFTLPGEVDANKVNATLEHGVLRLELPKAEHAKPRTIQVNVGAPATPAQIEHQPEAQASAS